VKNNKYMELYIKISDKFNSLSFEERSKICIYNDAQRLIDFEQLKFLLKKNYNRQLKEITNWENDIYNHLQKRVEEGKNEQ